VILKAPIGATIHNAPDVLELSVANATALDGPVAPVPASMRAAALVEVMVPESTAAYSAAPVYAAAPELAGADVSSFFSR
jgi:hypothetical protein